MSNGIVAALAAASTIAFINLILIIAFIVWRCKRWRKSKPAAAATTAVTSISSQPTMLKRKAININRIDLKPETFTVPQNSYIYTLPIEIQPVPHRNPIQSNRPTQRIWPPLDQFLTTNDSIMWRPVENEGFIPDTKPNMNLNEKADYLKRKRDPHIGSVKYLPEINGGSYYDGNI